jgi:hypothetical protein
MSAGHPITPSKSTHWYARYRKQEQTLAAEETASGKTEGSTEIDRLRDMLSRRTPKDVDYQDISQQLAAAYAEAYPGSAEDNAR